MPDTKRRYNVTLYLTSYLFREAIASTGVKAVDEATQEVIKEINAGHLMDEIISNLSIDRDISDAELILPEKAEEPLFTLTVADIQEEYYHRTGRYLTDEELELVKDALSHNLQHWPVALEVLELEEE